MNRSDEWHERRKHFIGASEVATIMNANPYGNQYELWATKKGMIPPFGGNEATQLGQDLESSILDVAERDFGAIERDVEYAHESLPLVATLDGESVDSHIGELESGESKSVSSEMTSDTEGIHTVKVYGISRLSLVYRRISLHRKATGSVVQRHGQMFCRKN